MQTEAACGMRYGEGLLLLDSLGVNNRPLDSMGKNLSMGTPFQLSLKVAEGLGTSEKPNQYTKHLTNLEGSG